jgi:hypothetical protein
MELTPEVVATYDTNQNGTVEGSELVRYLDDALKGVDPVNSTNNPKSGTDVTTKRTKLTTNTARALMESAAEAAGFTGKFSTADIAQFIKEFDTEQGLQIEKIVTSTSRKVTPGGTTEGAVDKTMESTAKTEYPSFFSPAQFASDWVWKKINFKDEGSLGASNLAVLAQVRGLIDKFQLIGISDAEAKDAAKLIAMGKKTIADYNVELQGKAAVEYPQFADRFKTNPTLTTYDIASPIINMVAETLEVDPKTVKMNHPVVLAYTRSAGADGKGVAPSYYDLLLKTKQMPEYQKTQQANNEARDAATSLGQALGFGLGA